MPTSLKDRLNKKDEEEKGILKYLDRPVSRAIQDDEARQPGGVFPEVAAPRHRNRRSQGVLGQPLKDAMADADRPAPKDLPERLDRRVREYEEGPREAAEAGPQEYYQPQPEPPKGKSYTDSELTNVEKELRDRYQRYRDDLAQLDGEDKVDFSGKLDDAKAVFDKAEANLEKRELVEMLSHALTQLGAGLYGMKHGVDLSGLPFNKVDWEKRYDRNMNKYKTELQRISEQQKESEDRRKSAIDRLDRSLRAHGEFALARRGQEEASRRHDDQMAARPDREGVEEIKGRQKQLQDWGTFLRDLQDDKRLQDHDLAASEIRRRAVALGADPAAVDKAIKDSQGWFGGNRARRAAAAVNELIPQGGSQQQQDGGQQLVERIDPESGRTALFDPATKQFVRWK